MNPRHHLATPLLLKQYAIPLIGIVFFFGLGEAAAADKVFVFHGTIRSFDSGTKALTLQADKRTYVFSVTDQTKIIRNQMFSATAGDIKVGEVADVEMKVGPDGKGIAVSVKLGSSDAVADSLFSATTPGGARLSGEQIKPLILEKAWPNSLINLRGPWKLKTGVYLMSVRPDGTVSNVEVLQSTGHGGMDGDFKKALAKWRFRPNSVREVRVAGNFNRIN